MNLPNCQTNWVIVLHQLSLMFWHFINTTVYLPIELIQTFISCHLPFTIPSKPFFRQHRLLGIKRKQTKSKRLLIFTLPSKATLRETKLTIILLAVVICHILLNLPHNICTILYSTMEDFWQSGLTNETRQSVSNLVRTKNFKPNLCE